MILEATPWFSLIIFQEDLEQVDWRRCRSASAGAGTFGSSSFGVSTAVFTAARIVRGP